MAKAKRIDLGDASSGIDITFTAKRRVLRIGGWYDHMVGIESHDLHLGEFLELLGITDSGIRQARREWAYYKGEIAAVGATVIDGETVLLREP
jgi:hypothetical protein